MSDRRNANERRNSKERRNQRSRRRNSTDRTAVIELSREFLRVAILDSAPHDEEDSVNTISSRWRHEAPSLNSELGLEELSAAFGELAREYDLQSAEIQIVLGGEYCVTKAIRGANDDVRNELQDIEQRSRLYLMLGPGEKVTVSKSFALDARHEHAIAAVCNKKTLDTIHEAANRSGMQLTSIEPALVAISRAIGRLEGAPEEPCIVLHVDKLAVELGVCHEGKLLLDYRPGAHSDPKELVDLICTHLNRLQRHVGRQLQEAPPSLERIYICGEKEALYDMLPAFHTSQRFNVERLAPSKIQATWSFVDQNPDSATIAALGSLLSTYVPANERNVPNFMEHILASTRIPMKPVLLRSAIPFAAVLLVAATLFSFNYMEQGKIDKLQEQVDSLASGQTRARALRLKSGAYRAKLQQLQHLSSQMDFVSGSEIITRIGQCMPSDVWLNKLTIDEMKVVQLTGASYLEAGVFDFVSWLDHAPGLDEVALRSTQPGQSASGPVINFDVELSLGDSNGPVEEVARNE